MKKKLKPKIPVPLYRKTPLKRKKLLQKGWKNGESSIIREDSPEAQGYRAPRCVELFAGAGGLAIAASNAGLEHDAVLEYNHDACETIRANQKRGFEIVRHWPLIEGDVHHQDLTTWEGRVDLVPGGPPCQPFSIGGNQAMISAPTL